MEEMDIVKLYRNGMSGSEILEKTDYNSTTSIYNKLEKHNVERRDKSKCQNPIKVLESVLRELYFEKDKTIREISNIYDCNSETIRRLMIEHGIERKDKTRNFGGWNKGQELSEETRKKISKTRKELYQSGELEHWNEGGEWSRNVKDKISESLKGKLVREDNPNWEGGANTEAALKRRRLVGTRRYKKWRNYVFERDDYTCQLCGKESEGDIQAHHIIPLREDFSLALDVDNGITLCENCHIHRINNHESNFVELFKRKVIKNERVYSRD